MFDDLPDSATAADLDDDALVAAIEAWTRATATVAAHRYAMIAELFRRRYNTDWEHDDDTCDAWDSVAAEISAASGISHHRAESDMICGADLSTRLPNVAALLLAGQISDYVARTIVTRTELIQDRELLATIDADLAEKATWWGALSKKKLDTAIDLIINEHDPGALKHTRKRSRDRRIWFGDSQDGVTEFGGWMDSTDAAQVKQRANLMATSVCKDDPRTLEQRRADALGALGAGSFHLQCRCANPTCPANVDDGRATNVTVHIHATEATLGAEPDPYLDGDGPLPADEGPDVPDGAEDAAVPEADSASAEDSAAVAEQDSAVGGDKAAVAEQDSDTATPGPATPGPATPAPTPAPAPVRAPGGVLFGFGVVPAAKVADMIARGAKVRYIKPPSDDPETGYTPSTALAEFVRSRYLTCSFPHCEVPAEFCDLDHVIPYSEGGPTHASTLNPKCRKHHLLKTFREGWSDVQHPDGRVVWTTPSGRTYTTKPGSSLFFPATHLTTAPIATGTPRPNSPDKHQQMPKRQRSRAKERAYRINAERALNDAHVTENNNPPF